MKKFIWMGPSGSNPLCGLVETGKEVTLNLNEDEIKSLFRQKLIQEIKTTKKKG